MKQRIVKQISMCKCESCSSQDASLHYVAEGGLEVKLPTIRTDGQAKVGRVREEKEKRRSEKRKREEKGRRKKIREENESEETRCKCTKRSKSRETLDTSRFAKAAAGAEPSGEMRD